MNQPTNPTVPKNNTKPIEDQSLLLRSCKSLIPQTKTPNYSNNQNSGCFFLGFFYIFKETFFKHYSFQIALDYFALFI